MMKKSLFLVFCTLIFFVSCQKETLTPISGEVTIDNTVYLSDTYYSFGFNFAMAKEVTTMNDPEPDLTIDYGILEGASEDAAYFAANTFIPSFSLFGQFYSTDEALSSFELLKTFGSRTWDDFGSPLAENQIWLVRTGEEKYTKILITDITIDTGESPTFVSCTFKWVYQPDGSTTFSE